MGFVILQKMYYQDKFFFVYKQQALSNIIS